MMNRWWAVLLLASPMLSAAAAPGRDALVLVVRADSPITTIDSLELRKAYVGLTVTISGGAILPLINDTQPELRALFLQAVVGFSESMYQRRLLTLTLQQGRAAPGAYVLQADLLQALRSSPYAVTYMRLGVAQELPQIRVVRVLWQN
jgi:hypothetical protein